MDIALGGMEQRKIQMLARENLEKIENEKVEFDETAGVEYEDEEELGEELNE